jgi:hypothetical protein
MWMSAVRRQYADNWKCEAQDDWQALVGEQRMFDESEEADTMLKNAFKGFKNLKHVHIDAYTQKNVYTDWNKAWGAKLAMRKAGFAQLHGQVVADLFPRFFLLDQGKGTKTPHGHHAKVLQVSGVIQNGDWTLELGFNAMNLRYENKPFDLASSD